MAGYIGSKAVNLSTTGADINGDANIDGDLSFRDNDKIKLGAGSDLQIYHDGSNSYVEDTAAGELILKSNGPSISFQKGDGTELFTVNTSGSSTLSFSGNAKLATTSTGVDITGTLTSDGLTVASASLPKITISDTDGGFDDVSLTVVNGGRDLQIVSPQEVIFKDAGTAANWLRIDEGSISFYEDTGTTPKFFWDASAESLGIGGTPDKLVHLKTSVNNTAVLRIESTATNSYPHLSLKNDAREYQLTAHGPLGDIFTIYDGTAGSHRFVISSSGNVGIGTSTPHDLGSSFAVLNLDGSNGGAIAFSEDDNATDQWLIYTNSDDSLRFAYGSNYATEAMRIDSSGNLLVGKTSATASDVGIQAQPIGRLYATRDGDVPLVLRRNTSDGNIAQFLKDGTIVGSIGTQGGELTIGNNDAGFKFHGGVDAVLPWNPGTNSNRDNAIDLGNGTNRFDDIFATNGTIQTSDRNEKQDIAELSDAEQRVAVAAKGLIRKFRWRDAVEAKGDEARTHFGIIAQDLQAAFVAEGLDAGDYAMFISSTWTDEETGEERTRMGVRYSELLAFIIGAL